jgi:benzodiazapine receptor
MMLKDFVKLAVCVAVCLAAGGLGVAFVGGGPDEWYGRLNKPWFNPPSWVFGPVWTVLYVLMGVAAFLVWRQGAGRGLVQIALGLFALQLVLNALWTPLFFGWHWIGGALVDIVLLWLAILATIVAFGRVSRPAALCLSRLGQLRRPAERVALVAQSMTPWMVGTAHPTHL